MPARAKATRTNGKPETRTRRLNIRATARQAELIRLGAERKGVNVSSFVVTSACTEAEQALADQSLFTLEPQPWARFLAALDRPARRNKNLANLMAEPSILER